MLITVLSGIFHIDFCYWVLIHFETFLTFFLVFLWLQFEVERLLTTIAFGIVEETIAVPIFVELLSSPSEDVREQARKQSNH